ncbi:MAG: hypothetical protein KC502_16695 [Myxococcales bacterium]|nr:hypothetical protein [Myxococcales bacterium]
MTHSLVSRIASRIALAVLLCALPTSAFGLAITINEIKAAKSATDGFAPNKRLGLTAAPVSDLTAKHVINKADCLAIQATDAPIVEINWSWTDYAPLGTGTATAAQYAIKVAQPGASCDANSMTVSSTSTPPCVLKKGSGSFASLLPVQEKTEINLKTDILGATNCSVETSTEAKVYFIVNDTSSGTLSNSGLALTFTIDTAAPKAPTVSTVSAGNKNLKVSWTVDDPTTTPYSRVYWSKISFPVSAPSQATSRSDLLTGSSYQITGLTNGETYYVAVTTMDANENESGAAKVVEAMPVPVQDLWQSYKASGGASEGGYYGCTASQSASPFGQQSLWLVLLASLALLLARRRRKHVVAAAVVLMSLATLMPERSYAESPRTMSLDLRFTYYTPMIDREFAKTSGATPFGDIMTGATELQYGASIDWRLLHGFGELGAGFSVGYWSQKGKARGYDGSASEDETELMVVPITLDLVYRFDVLAEKFRFPLVPYVKGGLAYGLWWARDGTGETSSYTDANNKTYSGEGGVAGLHGVVGIRLLLDIFEPKAARGFDIEMGVNHSYLYVEYQRLSLTNFGDAKSLDLSDELIVFGLAFDL